MIYLALLAKFFALTILSPMRAENPA